MPGRGKTSVENNGKTTDGKPHENDGAGLKQAIEEEAKKARESEPGKDKVDQADSKSLERIFTRLSKLPYNKAQEITGYPGFALSQDEEELNGILMTYIVIYHLPNIDMGKFCLWAFIILNTALLIEKTIVYVDYKKSQEETKKPAELPKPEKEKK